MPAAPRCPACGSEIALTLGRGLECRACGRPFEDPAAKPGRPVFVLGLDLGQSTDYTALAALEVVRGPDPARKGREANHYAVRHLERLKLGTPYPEMVEHVGKRTRAPELRGFSMAVDYTGVGRPVVDMLYAAALPVALCPILITSGNAVTQEKDGSYHVPKRHLVANLQVLLQSGRLKIARGHPEAAVLVKELAEYKVKITAAANETFNAREGQHDDLVLAVAMAAWLGERTHTGPVRIGMADGAGLPVPRGVPADAFGRRPG
jgi:hypothetical protein